MSRISCISGRSLDREHVAAWSRIQRDNPDLASPYFRPEFAQAVASIRDDVEIAVIEDGNQPVAFFPFQRAGWNVGKPVGGRLSDFHGMVAGPDAEWNPEDLLNRCRLSAWDFDHLPLSQERLRPYNVAVAPSPHIELGAGFDAYSKQMNAKSDELKQALRKGRKLEREVGPLRFEWHTGERCIFETLLRWKTQQYHSTHLTNVFSFPWTVALLERVLELQDEAFAGVLSALYVGDRLLAMHLGMRSFDVLHSWFPAYDREFYRFSPGLLLLAELCRAAPEQGIRRIDLGKGEEQYKTSFMTGATLVGEGEVIRKNLVRLMRRSWVRTRDWVKSSPLRGPARVPAGMLRRYREWRQFQ